MAVIGLGYVGLPLALTAAERGFQVLGFDTDENKVEALNAGRPYLRHVAAQRLCGLLAERRFSASADFGRLAEADLIAICVPTPLTPQREPDLRYVASTAQAISDRLCRGQLVVLESTTYPGTTKQLVQPILEGSGLVCGADFFLAYSPERENPGDPTGSIGYAPRVVGADDEYVVERLSRALNKDNVDDVRESPVRGSASRSSRLDLSEWPAIPG